MLTEDDAEIESEEVEEQLRLAVLRPGVPEASAAE